MFKSLKQISLLSSPRLAPRLCVSAVAFGICAPALGVPTQEEVFQSINQHVGSTVDVSKMVPYLIAGLGLVILIVWMTHRQRYKVVPRALNHAGKLIKEVSKKIGLRSGETRALKNLADEQEIASPLTLLLCPSLLGKALRSPDTRVDRANWPI